MTDAFDTQRRIERTAVAVCVATTCVAWLASRGGLSIAASVAAGGFLMAVSYITIRSGVGGLVSLLTPGQDPRSRRRNVRRTVLRMAGRYALLALLAYVMIARLRLHPLGLLAGVSSVVAAASIEAIRLQLQKKP
jgi:hypothetical protein